MRKEIVPILLIIIITVLVSSIWVIQTKINDAQKQSVDLQNQLTYYENSTNMLQTKVSNLETQIHELQNPIYNVTIENITSEPWYVPVGVAMFKDFSITIKNVGVRDVEGLTFKFEVLSNGTVWDNQNYEVGMTSPQQFGVLHVQESKVIGAGIRSSLDVSFAEKSLVVTVMLDKTVLNIRAVPLSSGFPQN